jgi:hypothetical protein
MCSPGTTIVPEEHIVGKNRMIVDNQRSKGTFCGSIKSLILYFYFNLTIKNVCYEKMKMAFSISVFHDDDNHSCLDYSTT